MASASNNTSSELDALLTTIKSDSEPDARNAIHQLVTVFRDAPAATARIVQEIEADQIISTNDIRKLAHSTRWNELGLAYIYRANRTTALEIFLHLSRREVKSPATFNNLGCVLVSIGQIDQARNWFSIAHAQDVSEAGFQTALLLPAYKNLVLLDKIGAQARVMPREQTPPSQAAAPQALLGVSKSELRQSIVTDFLIGGILAGLIFTFLSGTAQYLDATNHIPQWESLSAIGSAGIIIIFFAVVVIYSRAPEKSVT